MPAYKPAKALEATATKKQEEMDVSTPEVDLTNDALTPRKPRIRRGTRPAVFRSMAPKSRK